MARIRLRWRLRTLMIAVAIAAVASALAARMARPKPRYFRCYGTGSWLCPIDPPALSPFPDPYDPDRPPTPP